MLAGIIQMLRDFNRKSNERSKRRIQKMKGSFKSLSNIRQIKQGESETTTGISDSSVDESSSKTLNPISESIRNSTTKIKENSAKRKAEHSVKMDTLHKERDEARLKMDQADPGRKKTLHTLFIILAVIISAPLVIYDKWPANFFNRVSFIQNSRRGDLYIFIFTAMIIFLLLFPIQYYFLRRAAKRLALNSEKAEDKIEQTENNPIEEENNKESY